MLRVTERRHAGQLDPRGWAKLINSLGPAASPPHPNQWLRGVDCFFVFVLLFADKCIPDTKHDLSTHFQIQRLLLKEKKGEKKLSTWCSIIYRNVP